MTKMDLEAFRREDGGRRRSGDGGWVGVRVTVRVTGFLLFVTGFELHLRRSIILNVVTYLW
jgi:hypothetical protein